MHSPYLVTTHRYFCPSCRREVEDEEMVTNEDELQVPVRAELISGGLMLVALLAEFFIKRASYEQGRISSITHDSLPSTTVQIR